jgi:hypothetical protein
VNRYFKKLAYRAMRLRRLNLAKRAATVDPIARRILQDGIAIVDWHEVFGERATESHLFQQIKADAESFSKQTLVENAKDWKSSYLKRRYKVGDAIDANSPLFTLMAEPRLQATLRAFFGSRYRALAADYWHSVPSDLPPTGSQKWHTDPEDTVMCKLFVYLTDVDAESGATEFVLRSQFGGDAELRLCEIPGTSGRYYSEPEIESVRAHGSETTKACGPAGSLVFINTTGIHRGGRGTKERLMANYTFVSPWCPLPPRWSN